MKKTNKKKIYEAPGLTAVTFKTEKGYAESGVRTLFVHHEESEEVNTTFGRSSYGEATAESNTQQSWF